jgi:superfamily II DNA/RNA helicase
MKFSDLGLSDDILQAVTDAGYETPTPIQAKAIPYVLMNRDILGCAQTGTGKTASFTLPMIDILSHGRARARMPRSLILEPTRELAAQVAEQFEVYGKQHKFSMALLIGGVSFDEQNKALDRGADVLIATPGRLLDHVDRGKVLLRDVKVLVIDEADRMLDMGFMPDVEKIVNHLPKIRQTLFFSATMPPEIRRLSKKFLMNPKEISVDPPASTAATVEQGALRLAPRDKRKALQKLLQADDVNNALIFCNRKRDVDAVYKSLKQDDFNVGSLHGDMDQYSRMDTLEKFKSSEVKILVCSDVAARGLDIANVSHVFNFDIPTSAEDYVHRVGRTGRAGRKGKAITFVGPEDGRYLDAIVSLIGKKIPDIKLDGVGSAPAKNSDDENKLDSETQAPEKRTPRKRTPRKRAPKKQDTATQADPVETAPKAEDAQKSDTTETKTEDASREKPAVAKKPGRPRKTPAANSNSDAKSAKPEKSRSRRRTPDSTDDNGSNTPVGMGDHVPAFMRR